ncbi:hypothetical protein D1013_09740 [Euzebyella marina]|uniref:Uncharacterized protein n=1 Tax=Euzebyella marina TaxID=1761453 RepID=A0A3G2L5Y2_9FLAO|nr:hypothetical protein [Euzebyella marina]AYN67626.1 hypothetical protein D1013_09740 [Euzebyella marina]
MMKKVLEQLKEYQSDIYNREHAEGAYRLLSSNLNSFGLEDPSTKIEMDMYLGRLKNSINVESIDEFALLFSELLLKIILLLKKNAVIS